MSGSGEGTAEVQAGLTQAQVEAVLTADRGTSALLTSWQTRDFIKSGDNNVGCVTNLLVTYSQDGQQQTASYIVKTSGEHASVGFNDINKKITEVEIKFFLEVTPALNKALQEAGQEPLRVPRCFLAESRGACNLVVLEDLRARGFRMQDRHHGLDAAHARLVMQEVGRLHAASLLVQAQPPPPHTLTHKFPHLQNKWVSITEEANKFFTDTITGHIENVIMTLEEVGGYSTCAHWLRDRKQQAADIMERKMESSCPLAVLCHGDCWINNFLFRYSEDGTPLEAAMIDLQLNTVASPGIDLNYFMFTSVEGEDRRRHEAALLDAYHATVVQVAGAGGLAPPLTRLQVTQEYHDKHLYGLFFSIMVVPLILGEGEPGVDFRDMSDEKLTSMMKQQKQNLLKKLVHNPQLKSRLLATFDQLQEGGIIS